MALLTCAPGPGQFPDLNCLLTNIVENSVLSVDCTIGCVSPFLGWTVLVCPISLAFGPASEQCKQCLEQGDGAPYLTQLYECGFGDLCQNYIAAGDGNCDQENNTMDCQFDFGDCCTGILGDASNDSTVNVLDVVTVRILAFSTRTRSTEL